MNVYFLDIKWNFLLTYDVVRTLQSRIKAPVCLLNLGFSTNTSQIFLFFMPILSIFPI